MIPTVKPPLISATKSLLILYFGSQLMIGKRPTSHWTKDSLEQETEDTFDLTAFTYPFFSDNESVERRVARRGTDSSYTFRSIRMSGAPRWVEAPSISLHQWENETFLYNSFYMMQRPGDQLENMRTCWSISLGSFCCQSACGDAHVSGCLGLSCPRWVTEPVVNKIKRPFWLTF